MSKFVFFFLVSLLRFFPATGSPNPAANNTWHGLIRFLDAGKGSEVDGMAELKGYLRRFGYLPENTNFTDIFDEELETALLSYQKNLGLPETGKLDQSTMTAIVSPRCGCSDFTTRRFAYFPGKPRWAHRSPMMLTYAFSNSIDYVSQSDLKAALSRAFSQWSAVIPVGFAEAEDGSHADIMIGWYGGDHGDGRAFDGPLGVTAHAFSPEDGRLHLDAAERWAVDLAVEKSEVAVDLESVATHEIGHVLGLMHSKDNDAVMYPSLSPRTKKVHLGRDDVEGIQALYGSRPGYRYESPRQPGYDSQRQPRFSSSAQRMVGLETRKGLSMKWSFGMVILVCASFLQGFMV